MRDRGDFEGLALDFRVFVALVLDTLVYIAAHLKAVVGAGVGCFERKRTVVAVVNLVSGLAAAHRLLGLVKHEHYHWDVLDSKPLGVRRIVDFSEDWPQALDTGLAPYFLESFGNSLSR